MKLPAPSTQYGLSISTVSKFLCGVSLCRKRLIVSGVPSDPGASNLIGTSGVNSPFPFNIIPPTGYKARLTGVHGRGGSACNPQLTVISNGTNIFSTIVAYATTDNQVLIAPAQGLLGFDSAIMTVTVGAGGSGIATQSSVQADFVPTTTPRFSLSNLSPAAIDVGVTMPLDGEPRVIDIDTYGEFVQRAVFAVSNVAAVLSVTEVQDWERFRLADIGDGWIEELLAAQRTNQE